MKRLAKAILIVCLIINAQAQVPRSKSTLPALPPGPLVQKRAPESARWIIMTKGANDKEITNPTQSKVSNPQANPELPQNIERTVFQKSGKLILITHVDTKKVPWPVWCMGSLEIVSWPGGKACDVLTPPPNPDSRNPLYTDLSKSDFQGLDWVTLEDYTDLIMYKGRKCIVFKKVLEVKSEDPAEAPRAVTVSAYVDLESRLPLLSVYGDDATFFEWQTPPPTPLSLPSEVAALLEKRQRGFDEMIKPSVKPL